MDDNAKIIATRVGASVIGVPAIGAIAIQDAKTAKLGNNNKTKLYASVVALGVVLTIGSVCAYDAYKQSHSKARAIGGFFFPIEYATLIRKW